MNITFTGHGIEVTQSLKSFTEEKLNKLERHFNHIININIVFRVEKLRQMVEATVLLHKFEIHASAESEIMYTAIDTLIDKLDKQIIKHKEKIKDHRD
jgi:putative sigma-54 modulation protein